MNAIEFIREFQKTSEMDIAGLEVRRCTKTLEEKGNWFQVSFLLRSKELFDKLEGAPIRLY